MAVTHATALRTVLADAVDAYLNTTGSADASADLLIRDSTTSLINFTLENPAFGAASSGVITAAGVPIAAVAIGDGDADNFQIRDRDNAVALSGSVTGTGGGGDIEIDNISVVTDQNCSLDSLTYTAPV